MPVDPTAATHAAIDDSSPPLAASAPHVIGERYEILGLLGSGAMGNVYKARDRELDDLCALKVLRPELGNAPGALDRFRREVKLARRVTHPNVARVFDLGERGGEKILTMELIDGEPLSALLRRERRLSLARLVAIASAICAGLGAAHEAGVVHRDLKPDNVLIEKGGRVVLTDFGIARAAAEGSARATQAFVGTPAYMAPEQIEGGAVDARADLYALGVMLFELATGELPFQGETLLAVAAARLLRPPPDPRGVRGDLPDRLAALILRCLARSPEDRFPSAAAVAAELPSLTTVDRDPAPVLAQAPSSAPPTFPVRAPGEKRVAVLPFRNTGSPEHDYVADGLTEDVIDVLSMAPGLRVVSRGVVMRYRGSDRDPREVGRELDVQVVVDGAVYPGRGADSGHGRVRISARLATVADGVQIWARRFERPEAELFAMTDDVARAIADALAVDVRAPSRPLEADPEAMDLYLRARAAYRIFFTDIDGGSLALFERALALAPDDPRILAGFAAARARIWSPDPEVARSADRAARRAVELAPDSTHAWTALGAVEFQAGDEAGAVRSLRRALVLSPANAEAHDQLGRILSETTKISDARRHLLTAITLEPEISLARLGLARSHELAGDHEEADRLLEERPAAMLPARARVLLWRRDQAGARALLASLGARAALTILMPVRAMLEVTAHRAPPYEALHDFFVGRRSTLRAQTFFLQLEVEVSMFLGDRDRALDALRRGAERPLFDLRWIDHCPLLAELRGEEAFAAAREKVAARAAAVEAAYLKP